MPEQPIRVLSLPFNSTGRLAAAGPSASPSVTPGNTTLWQFAEEAELGSVAYFSISTSARAELTLGACSKRLRLQVAVFVDEMATW